MDNVINGGLPTAEGKPLVMGEILAESWQLFKRAAGLWVGGTVLVVVIALAIQAIPLVGQLVGTVLTWPLFSGMTWMGLKQARGQRIEFPDFFAGFGPAFMPLLIGGIIYHVLFAIGLLLLVIPGIYLAVSWWPFATLLIMDKNLGGWEALEASRKCVGPRWWWFLGLWGVMLLALAVGTLACGVGFFVAVPLVNIAFGVTYRRVYDPAADVVVNA